MEFPLTFEQALIACIIAFFGAVLQGSVGFGLGPIAVPLLVLLDPVFVPGPVLFAALFLTALLFFREHYAVKLAEVRWAVLGRIIGSTIGAMFLTYLAKDKLSLFNGVVILVAIGISASGFHLRITIPNLIGAGTLSGFMGTTTSIGGAPMAMLYNRKDGPRLRGTLSGIFSIGTIIAIISLVIIGRFGLTEILVASVMLPGIILGFLASKHTAKLLDRGFIRPAVLIVSAFTACAIIIRNIT